MHVTHPAAGTTAHNLCKVPCLPPLSHGNAGPIVCPGLILGRIKQAGHPALERAAGNAQEGTGCWRGAKNTAEEARRGTEGPRGSPAQ